MAQSQSEIASLRLNIFQSLAPLNKEGVIRKVIGVGLEDFRNDIFRYSLFRCLLTFGDI